ncbi:hypothetical protein HED60_02985 [Planctomycetales bacterium ZRK34]|nr:hypothetical protein HED60_02985 [Planctomycetales bacterium ZRK34]
MFQHARFICTLSVIMLLVGATLSPAADAEEPKKADEKTEKKEETKSPAQFKKISVNEAVRDLVLEAKKKMRELQVWPRQTSDYAVKTNTMIESEEVIKALGRRLDRLGVMDGYVKWQLLSYQPSLVDASPRELEAIVRFFPQLMPRPNPTAAQMRIFKAAEQRALPQYKDKIRAEISEYELAVANIANMNKPAMEYRDKIIFELPEDNGLRLQVKLMDAQDRFVAGDMSYEHAIGGVIRDARSMKTDKEKLPPSVRAKLLQQIEKLKSSPNPMIDNVNLMNSGEVNLIKIGGIFKHKQYEQLKAYLEGRDPD